ncbi:hypothetical protein KP004_17490 [Geomonas oryzisoli]|uniref:Uncharacterized protein n=1 Tax=Geomonas oryzisoli TaxID=2847992 RepID=A0ABX8J796_9BACT|nr:hypothetical protein [Geomonas oryzisoli]QWV92941.1 hypothetical protein KP004_17490 [Geomonas oryzisoli]
MTGSKKNLGTDWERVKQEAVADVPVLYDAETDLYDPNDAEQVADFFAKAKVVRKPRRTKDKSTKDLHP